MIVPVACSRLITDVSRTSTASVGSSYGSETPVNCLMSPALALAYRPLRSRSSHTSTGVATWMSRKSPTSDTICLTCSLAAANGAIGAQIAMPPCLAISAATYPILAILRSRSARENVRPAESSERTRSPSSSETRRSARSASRSRRSLAIVDLPDPDRPVRNSTTPRSERGGLACLSSAATASDANHDGIWAPVSSMSAS